jgi:hypothetical protein
MARAELVPGSCVEDAVCSRHGPPKTVAIGDVARVELHAERLEQCGFLRRSHERGHLVTAPDELLD